MNILAFDTTLGACSVAVGLGAGSALETVEALYEEMATGQAERLMPMIAEAMHTARLDFAAIDRIAVTLGPGTFTGSRIGIAAARALSLATGASLVGTSTLHLMAEEARRSLRLKPHDAPIFVAVDAHRGQVYSQLFAAADAQALSPPHVLSVPEAAALTAPGPVTCVGSGAPLVAEAARAAGHDIDTALPELQPNAAFLLLIAQNMQAATGPISPIYLRPADAKPQSGKSLARVTT